MDEAAVYTLKPHGKRKRVFRVTTYFQMAQKKQAKVNLDDSVCVFFVLYTQLLWFKIFKIKKTRWADLRNSPNQTKGPKLDFSS